ncbi:putative acetyltransferase [Panicum miliaceum]|uniref:Acetyltransferase n=1 Tax=Panicum miliaceum TaxID=4540 RepID=A0A3L6RG60_PANMI|nr:putative acetyltransferase [Panicum miliaceum]
MEGSTAGYVQIVSKRVVRPDAATSPDGAPSEPETMHLTPWDLRVMSVDYIQKGVLLPKPETGGEAARLVDGLASSFARALGRFYPLAGRLAVAEATDGGEPAPSIVVSLRCNGEGAEFVHAVAPEVTVSDIAAPVYVPPVVWALFPLNGVLGTDVSRPVLAAQVTELADGVFVAMSLNHGVADGTTFWHLFNTWSEISRRSGSDDAGRELSTPPPVLDRWFPDSCPVPIRLPFARLEDMVRRPVYLPVRECFFDFSSESVKALKEKANAEMAGTATATISSLQSLLAHTWRAACRARELLPDRETTYTLLVGCRGRVRGVPQAYMGNAVTLAVARSTAGDVAGRGLGWAAWLLNRAVASFDEGAVRGELARWPQDPRFVYVEPPREDGAAAVATGSSPRFDVYGNDFGWGRPVGVRSGAGNKMDGKVTVYEGRGGAGSMALEVCLSARALARLVADEEFMEAVVSAGAAA